MMAGDFCSTANRSTAGAFSLVKNQGVLRGVAGSGSANAQVRVRETDATGRVLYAGSTNTGNSLGPAIPPVPFDGGLYLEIIAGTVHDVVVYYT